jgi:hydroxyacylglutathione hydrolase
MSSSLDSIASLPDETLIYCAHEYTEANLRFALAVEPENPALLARVAKVAGLRAAGQSSVPSSLAEEKATNPFLRCTEPAVIASGLHHVGVDSVFASATVYHSKSAIFAMIRSWRNGF